MLGALENHEIIRQVEVTCRLFYTTTHSFMVHAIFLEAYIHFSLIYTEDHIFPVLTITYLINKGGDPTTPFKIVADKETSLSNLIVLFCPYVVRKATTHVGTKALNMRHQAQKGFCGIFIGIPQHQKGYLVYIPHRRNIISSYSVVFYESLYILLSYTPQPYS